MRRDLSHFQVRRPLLIAPSPARRFQKRSRRDSARRRLFSGLTAGLTLVGLVFGVYSLSAPSAHQGPASTDAPQTATTPALPAQNKPETPPAEAEAKSPEETTKPLKAPAPPEIHAASAILVDAASGQVLYEKNADAERAIASTTKIMTALLLCENVRDENTIITASKNASLTEPSSLNLKPGEKVCCRDLLHAILMRSANDACVAAAEHISGTEAAFAEKMTARAKELGALHTHFANSNGLPIENHYSTARDLALIARTALQEARIAETVKTKYYKITRSINKSDVRLKNHSKFLFKFAGADGVKTGWTVKAGHCYVGSATWNGWKLIAVVLKSPNYVEETRALMKYGFYNFTPHLLAKAGDPAGLCPVNSGTVASVPAVVKSPLQYVTRQGETPAAEERTQFTPTTAPVAPGTILGAMTAWVSGKPVATAPLVAAASVPAATASVLPAPPHRSAWKSWLIASLLAMGLVSLRYGTRAAALTKSSRKRRSSLAANVRGDDFLG